MVSAETATATMAEAAKMVLTTDTPPSSTAPRISFSADLSSEDSDGDFICINPEDLVAGKEETDKISSLTKAGDFEFLSENITDTQTMITADELFSEGKLLPFWQVKHSEKLKNVTLKAKVEHDEEDEEEEEDHKVVKHEVKEMENSNNNNDNRGSWFLDDDPSPRPPKCTVLWKELLRLKKQRTTTTKSASSLSPSSSSSSTSSSSSSIGDAVKTEERDQKEGKRGKKVLERTRSMTMRIRPMVHVPVCTPSKSSAPLPPLFPLKLQKNREER